MIFEIILLKAFVNIIEQNDKVSGLNGWFVRRGELEGIELAPGCIGVVVFRHCGKPPLIGNIISFMPKECISWWHIALLALQCEREGYFAGQKMVICGF